MRLMRPKLEEKLGEAFKAVLPVVGIVLLLCFCVAPVSPGIVMEFLVGAVFLIVGMMFFTLGAELSMTPMGEEVGRSMTRSKKLWVFITLGFILGFVITISEPDLQVLAGQVPSIPNMTLILYVAVGVGIFLVVIANQGYSNMIMDAAKSAGAGGGTVIHARGTGMERAESFFGVSLASEKEIIFIVSKTGQRSGIMKAVMEKAGMVSKAKSIIFSLPVSSTAGLRLLEDEP